MVSSITNELIMGRKLKEILESQTKNKGVIISGFPGVGKSHLVNQAKKSGNELLDSDSSTFDKKNFPENYIKHIKKNVNTGKSIYTLRTKNLHYESDWNWLMKVVEKIEGMWYEVSIIGNECEIGENIDAEHYRGIVVCREEEKKSKLMSVFSTVVEFIKWYNNE